ncbi:hypothetical protein K6119_00420 [Paracrocinitomix mangrovi]|uniref:hypothetical protein n=1 Tax=Paracrocinitomix mangrovi TaxID=2862509 RepID=UPI001C8D0751|nr:hypothetical protein [Paracrocinitomix mangrovi]UKN01978.1 hypothetical protein K6119_00420 [Paracrocinitomix mangrovi]
MIKQTFQTYNGFQFELIFDKHGYCLCPVCGEKAKNKDWRPYDENGYPSYDICACGFEFGYDDGGEPPFDKSWELYREEWYKGELDFGNSKSLPKKIKDQQLDQLLNSEK